MEQKTKILRVQYPRETRFYQVNDLFLENGFKVRKAKCNKIDFVNESLVDLTLDVDTFISKLDKE